jgi:PAS domain S-box-containing protein
MAIDWKVSSASEGKRRPADRRRSAAEPWPSKAFSLPPLGSLATRLAIAVGLVLVATLARWGLGQVDPRTGPFTLYFPAVLLAALLGGWRVGALALALALALAWWLFMQPMAGHAVSLSSALINMGLYAVAAAAVVAAAGYVGMLVRRLDSSQKALASSGEIAQRMAAIVESSDDAIISKNLDGVILSWNQGAQRLFGYTAAEAIGQPVTMLIPPDRQDEEPGILDRIRRGERIDHYETVRRRKDGGLIDISLTVSPIKNALGAVVGASKIARDNTERKRLREQQQLLLREMDHRVKNLFTVAAALVSVSARTAAGSEELASDLQGRLAALGRAHALTVEASSGAGELTAPSTMLHALIRTLVSPYDDTGDDGGARVTLRGADPTLSGAALTSLALLIHEFATNAAKYGALSVDTGRIDIDCAEAGDRFALTWCERGGPLVEQREDGEGFGSFLVRAALQSHLGGEISRDWRPEGLTIRLSLARDRMEGVDASA